MDGLYNTASCSNLSVQVGSYCGADGVDDWAEDRWTSELAKHQVGQEIYYQLVMVSASFFWIRNVFPAQIWIRLRNRPHIFLFA